MIAPCAAALLLWLWRYCALEPIETRYEWAAALSDLLLYAAIGCAFVFRWFALWRGETRRETEPPKVQTVRAPWKTDLRIFLALLGVHAARKRRWAVSSVFGGLAAFTRSVGILLLVPVCFLWLTEYLRSKDRKTLLWGLLLLLIPAGFGAYLLINLIETGSAWTFTVMQREHWSQTLGPFFGAARYSAAYAVNWFRAGKIQDAIGLWGAGLFARFSALFLMLFTAKRQHPADLAYVLVYYAVTMGATWLLSAPRYLLVLYPLVLAAAILGKNRRFDALFSAACLVLGQAYLYAFLFRFDVY